MTSARWRSTLLGIAAPLLAIALAVLVTSLVLVVAGDPVGKVWQTLLFVHSKEAARSRAVVNIINSATVYYFSALAVAIGFRMRLFNIGVEGQYRFAAFAAAYLGASVTLPKPLHVLFVLVVAMLAGALWAAVPALLKVTRGVSEVISTIMLNSIATALVAWLLRKASAKGGTSLNLSTKTLPDSAHVGGISIGFLDTKVQVYGLVFLAVVAGAVYWFAIERTRFGFDLRATGRSETAAVASGVDVRRMVVAAMLLSGAVAGLVGIPALVGTAPYNYSLSTQSGLGFTGIAIALLGRNTALGIAVGALLWAYLDIAANPLQIQAGVSTQLVTIMQGTIVLSVVVAYELVRRYRVSSEQRRVAAALRPGPAAQGAAA
ncbi:simple sugar transport system permease protein [Motilibacter peucedani]|uniref:Simple sugar transport system permease protein n=1 Tax=Motilibacter peucedani TaxID=598650 RepID=A0A420XL68_9ACTN|nr:ABC transporter permease [Motilibacter peucedani]RKS69382.1 simple sugar transport system permease protein [Motilibacter peucedani]